MHDVETKTPISFNKSYSSKGTTLMCLKGITDVINKNYPDSEKQVLLLTPYGFIKGDLHDNNDDTEKLLSKTDDDKYCLDLSVVTRYKKDALENAEKENGSNISVVGDGSTLNLKNVTVYKDDLRNPVLNIDQLIVFADQVISFSLVPKDL
ncbi:hypothetical protein [Paenibacillus alvei]|uniref:hypothetical protein n=1 Tax=Paenibacillus alvei TaxID=44250 RepID=UPI00227DF58E|nr:hypothetical protein [Paenibacillus alvei]MCY7485781.1 hypothetical protein [Paenibacillus alvei]